MLSLCIMGYGSHNATLLLVQLSMDQMGDTTDDVQGACVPSGNSNYSIYSSFLFATCLFRIVFGLRNAFTLLFVLYMYQHAVLMLKL